MKTYEQIGTFAAGVVAAVDPVADTETQIMTVKMIRDCTIYEIQVNYGNVVDAKAASGFIELKSDQKQGPWRYPIGFGCGGAATVEARAEPFKKKVNIPVVKNETITIYATMCEAGVAAHAMIKMSVGGVPLGYPTRPTFGDCNQAEDAAITAVTRENGCGSITIPAKKGGIIKKVSMAVANVVNAKDCAGYIEFLFSNLEGEHNVIIGGGGGGATNSGFSRQPAEQDVNWPVVDSEVITPYTYFTDAQVNAHIGIEWET